MCKDTTAAVTKQEVNMEMIGRLERVPVGRFHYKLLFATGLGWLFDAMDTGIIAFVLPSLAKAWNLTAAQMGYIGSIGLLGMALGAVLAGFAADRFGRKTVFSITLALYSVATGLCGIAWNFESLLVFRFLVGFGLGGELPVAVTLMSEYAPPGTRGKFIVLLESFWGFGWLVAALLAYLVIPTYGWQSAFFIGALPALYALYIRQAMPESVRYLVEKGRYEEAEKIIHELETAAELKPAAPLLTPAVAVNGQTGIQNLANTEKKTKVIFGDLWRPELRQRTLVLWLLWFGIVYSYYGIFTWLPSLLVNQGYTVLRSFECVLIMTLAQLPGYFSAAYLVDRLGRRPTLASYLFFSAISAYFFGHGTSPTSLLIWGSLMSFFNLGAWGVIYTYTPELYPTRIRAFGSGWAAAVGRTGGILAPSIVGFMLLAAGGFAQIFAMFTCVMIITAGIVWFWGEETMGKSLDDINDKSV